MSLTGVPSLASMGPIRSRFLEIAPFVSARETALLGQARGQLGPLYNWLLIPLLLRHVFADKERQEAIIKATPIGMDDRATGGIDERATDRDLSERVPGCGGLWARVSRADVAHFMLKELENPRYVRQFVPLC